ncbi:hypothetical protein BP6252_06059 [Coleophoma cylindrospora]|uniref:Hydantoinase n=1 Tax=Coleophoma cylindrospora TaxID=1849047 RepID=A0A3D8RLI4_9HELO|nr:hypothetical protein BP6252_06059 [Coleophoma cylindrospora]
MTTGNEKVFHVGVDVGGTNTDSIVLHPGEAESPHRGIRSSFKTPTTADVTEGISLAIDGALKKGSIDRNQVSAVMIGTTHFINAVVQADDRNLRKVAVFRLCGPYTRENPAFFDFPPILKKIMNGHVAYLDGGLEIDGREILPLKEAAIRQECQLVKEKGISEIVVIGVFSPLDYSGLQEERVKKIILEELPGVDVVLSRDIGQIGFLERENATILNASILKFARRTIRGFMKAMKSLGLSCPLFLTQNDGTIISAEQAQKCPIKTFSSGPTNSMAGAAYLAGLGTNQGDELEAPVIVADIGGTTTDVCALLPSGFPRQAGTWVEVGGVRCAFSMPEVVSIGLGGGTKVMEDENGVVTVGPDSTGYRLLTEGLVFGGNTLTATDIVVASGKEQIGDTSRVSHISEKLVSAARMEMKRLLERAIDGMKLTADDAIVVLVGGGSIVQMDSLKGVSRIIRPSFYDCANAVGAAMAKVSGEVDMICITEGKDETKILEEALALAAKKAIEAGADPNTIRTVSIDNMPLEYTAMKAARLLIKVAGQLSKDALMKPLDDGVPVEEYEEESSVSTSISAISQKEKDPREFTNSPSAFTDIRTYKPEVDSNGTWWVSEIDAEFLATGCSVLACGGGGPGYMIYQACRAAIQAGHKLPVVDIETMTDEKGMVFGSVSYGAPTVTSERLPSGTEGASAIDGLLTMFPGAKPAAMLSIEIGGMNGILPLMHSINYKTPTIDGDLMGRAYPRLYIMTPYLFGRSATPCVQSDGMGNTVAVLKADNMHKLERIHRKAALEIGLFSQMAPAPLTIKDVREVGTLGTMSLAWYIGRGVYQARQEKTSIIQAILDANPSGKLLYTGKIVDVRRYVSAGGYTEGRVRLMALSREEKEFGETSFTETRDMVLPFQNEYLLANLQNPDGTEETLSMVPDLISLIGSDGFALGTQDIKYGVRVSVVSFVAHPHWYTKQGVATGGPREFGYDLDFLPLGNPYYEPKRVTKEFRASA